MRKLVNHLGCACTLPGDLSQKRFVCENCQTCYERNPTVHRWYVVWIAPDKATVDRVKRPSRRLGVQRWANGGERSNQADTDQPTASDDAYIDPDADALQAVNDRATAGLALNDPTVECCGRDAADCDCEQKSDEALEVLKEHIVGTKANDDAHEARYSDSTDDMPASWNTEGNATTVHCDTAVSSRSMYPL